MWAFPDPPDPLVWSQGNELSAEKATTSLGAENQLDSSS